MGGMEGNRKKHGGVATAAFTAALIVLLSPDIYVLSFGPASTLNWYGWLSDETWHAVYSPLFSAMDRYQVGIQRSGMVHGFVGAFYDPDSVKPG